jgi:hypothetical protein
MKYFVVEPFTIETQQGVVTLPAGKVLELSQDQAARLGGNVRPADESILDLWRWFTLEADKIYRQSSKAADSWERHKEHKQAAIDFCNAGRKPEARAELEKALTALQGAATTQQELIAA